MSVIAPVFFGAFFRDRKIAMQSLINYLKETRVELRHVSWPTQKQAAVYTALIIAVSVVVSLILGLFDFLFTGALDWFITR